MLETDRPALSSVGTSGRVKARSPVKTDLQTNLYLLWQNNKDAVDSDLIKSKHLIMKSTPGKLGRCLLLALLVISFTSSFAQGKVEISTLYASSLENPGGEDPERRVTVYLPPGYETSDERYPVIYFLHGFTSSDSINMVWFDTPRQLDKALRKDKIRPFIFVMSDQYTLYRGSFYTNSGLTGNWVDFTSKDLVNYIDSNYRTIRKRESRGIAGWSMGGFGAIKIGMLRPEVFGTVYSLSAAAMGLVEELGPDGNGYRRAPQIESREQMVSGYDEFYANAVVSMGRAFSPNLNNPPHYADLPYIEKDGEMVADQDALELWNKNLPINMVDEHVDALKGLTALKMDWGRNDSNLHIPISNKDFSLKLEQLGIAHFAEEYLGDHSDKIWSDDGRVLNDMLPFFDTYLKFE